MRIESGMVLGIAFTAIVVPLVAYLLYRGKLRREAGMALLVISSLLGFLFFAPMFPWQLQLLMLDQLPRQNLPLILVAISAVALSSLLVGRAFCGYVCPPGALQELAYLMPIKKFRVPSSITTRVRWAVFALMLVLALAFSFNLTRALGMRDLFTLALTASALIFLLLILASAAVYRPFCRFVCPFGALSSLFSGRSVLGVRRKEGCVDCGRCERVCPAMVLKERAGSECYLCGRCMESCNKDALKYTRREKR